MGNSSNHSNQESFQDEYPLVWFDPDINSEGEKFLKASIQKNKSLHLFSNLRNALEFIQSLGISFQIILPISYDKEEILKDFGALKDTYGRRLADFEEESIVAGLVAEVSPEIIKSFQVYVFYTKKDFESEVPAKEDEEEVDMMCSVSEMAKQFREEFAVFWCDTDISSEKKKIFQNELGVEEKNIFTDFDVLYDKMMNYNGLPYHLILSGNINAELIFHKINDFKDLLGVYLYENLRIVDEEKMPKVRVAETVENLVPKIKQGIRENTKSTNVFPSFATIFDDRDISSSNKVHYYLTGLMNFLNRRQAKRDFIKLLKNIYQDKDKVFLEFEKKYDQYDAQKILRWYTKSSPIYMLLNNCLRIATSDSILYCRYFIQDMERAIRELFQKEENKYNGVVYRGAKVSEMEWEKLRRNVGKEIEIYSFLSTSKKSKTASRFFLKDVENNIFITIIVPPLPQPELDKQGFVDMAIFSEFPEEEILLNVKSRFKILEAENIKCRDGSKVVDGRHLVLFYGPQLLRKSMTKDSTPITLELKLPKIFKCDYCESGDDLFTFTTSKMNISCRKCLLSHSIPKNIFMLPVNKRDEDSDKTDILFKVKGKILKFNEGTKFPYYGYKCGECSETNKKSYYKWINQKNGSVIFQCSDCFAQSKDMKLDYLLFVEENPYVFWDKEQEEWEKINRDFLEEDFEEAKSRELCDLFYEIQSYSQCQEYCQKALTNLVRKRRREKKKEKYYQTLGRSHLKLGNFELSLDYFRKSRDIIRSIYGDIHPTIASLYTNFGEAYARLRQFSIALEFFKDCLDINRSIYGEKHFALGYSYNNLASIYSQLGEYQTALEYNKKSLEITKLICGEKHPSTAVSYHSLGEVYFNLNDFQKALECDQKSLEITKSIFGEIHYSVADTYQNLGEVYRNLNENQKALECGQKSLEITEAIYGEMHPTTALSYRNLGQIYSSLGKYSHALGFAMKALEINKSTNGEKHANTATSYNNLGTIYEQLGEYQKALEYYIKAFHIMKSLDGEKHPLLAALSNNLGEIYCYLGDYENALKFSQESLEITTSIFGKEHQNITVLYSNIGMIYKSLGEPHKALEYYLKSLDMAKSIWGEINPGLSITLNNIGEAYLSLDEYQKALEYFKKAMKMGETIYGEMHPSTAVFYQNIGTAYSVLGEEKIGLEYSQKSLKISEQIFGEMHPNHAIYSANIGGIYQRLGEYQKAVEYYLKALSVKKSVGATMNLDAASLEEKIGESYQSLGEYHKALEYFERDIQKKQLMSEYVDPDLASSYCRIGVLYGILGQHRKAIEHHLKALSVTESFYGEMHPDTANIYDKIGENYGNLRDYQKALVYFEKAIHIKQFTSKKGDPDLASSYCRIGVLYGILGEYQKAIEYSMESLENIEFISEEPNHVVLLLYLEIGWLYLHSGQLYLALVYFCESYLKSLNVVKLAFGEAHMGTASIYLIVGEVYFALGEYQKAVDHYMKSLHITKLFYGETHVKTLPLYQLIAEAYRRLGEYPKAIEYFMKSLFITKSICGENSESAELYRRIDPKCHIKIPPKIQKSKSNEGEY